MNNKNPISQLPELLPIIIKLAYEAGDKIMHIRQKANYDVNQKVDNSPVTEADYASHHHICDGLNSLPHAWPVLSEEDPDMTFDIRKQWKTYWLIDPLDGTRDFIAGRETFSVNIALIHNHQPILGVIQLPVTGECFSAYENYGAWKQLPAQKKKPIQITKLDHRNPVISVSGARKNEFLQNMLSSIGEHELKFIGSSIKSCRVAEGVVDFYPCLGPTSEWDTAAAQCIIEQAGGHLTNVKGDPLRYNERETLINPWFIVYGDSHYDWYKHLPDNPQATSLS